MRRQEAQKAQKKYFLFFFVPSAAFRGTEISSWDGADAPPNSRHRRAALLSAHGEKDFRRENFRCGYSGGLRPSLTGRPPAPGVPAGPPPNSKNTQAH